MIKKIILLITLATLILAGLIIKTKLGSTGKKLLIEDKITIEITIANTDETRSQGYSNHQPIGFNEGLLFVFEKPDIYPFWMKEMLFDLDFIFVKNGQIVYLLKNIKAPVNNNGQINYAISQEPFDQILEVKSGFIDKFNIQLKDRVSLK